MNEYDYVDTILRHTQESMPSPFDFFQYLAPAIVRVAVIWNKNYCKWAMPIPYGEICACALIFFLSG